MTTQEVANRLVELCRAGDYQKAHDELYHENAQSWEPTGAPVEKVQGIDAIRQKGQQWSSMVEEMHSANISDPVVTENHFAITMENDVTFKGAGRRWMKEVCVYEVQKGKVVKEQFFYNMGPQGE